MKNLILTCLITLVYFVSYSQCLQGDCQNGEGTFQYKSGNKYQGHFKNGKKDGFGKFIWKSGERYKGDWVNDKRQGNGEELLKDGSKYVGEFYADQKHGKGTMYDSKGNVTKSGTWQNGQFYSQNNNQVSESITKSSGNKKVNPNQNFEKLLNIGLGFGTLYDAYDYYNNGKVSRIPPISVSFDFYKVNENITIGGYAGYSSSKVTFSDEYLGTYGWRSSYIILGVRGKYNFKLFESDKWKTYGGVLLGYNIASSSFFGDDLLKDSFTASASGLAYSGYIGLNYFFNDNMGIFSELGYGISYLTCGITKKF